MIEELPPIPERNALPSMLDLYRRDLHYQPGLHYDLPVRIAYNFCSRNPRFWPHLMDFVQEGSIQLLRCKEVFQGEDAGAFRCYAAICIKGAIYKYIPRLRTIYIPISTWATVTEIRREELNDLLKACTSWEASYEEIMSIEEPTNVQHAFCEAKRKQVDELLAKLTERERQAITLHYGLDGIAYSHEEIAHIRGNSVPNIYQALARGIERMKCADGKKPVENKRFKEREAALARVYKEPITTPELARRSGQSHYAAHMFLQARRGKQRETNAEARHAAMEVLYAEWQARGEKVTVLSFRRAGHWNSNEVVRFLREKK
jgi:RNA polymerase sigma factor (sigma-70 family)